MPIKQSWLSDVTTSHMLALEFSTGDEKGSSHTGKPGLSLCVLGRLQKMGIKSNSQTCPLKEWIWAKEMPSWPHSSSCHCCVNRGCAWGTSLRSHWGVTNQLLPYTTTLLSHVAQASCLSLADPASSSSSPPCPHAEIEAVASSYDIIPAWLEYGIMLRALQHGELIDCAF